MGMLTRVCDIVNSNINSALDKAEDPEKLIKQMVREMEDTLIEIKAACASVMASRKRAQRDIDRTQGRARHWASRAELAMDRAREDLAREALKAKRQYADEAEIVQREIDQLDVVVGQYKGDIVQIEEKLGSAREKQRVLVQRHIHAVQRRRAEREIRRLDSSEAILHFEEFQSRLDRAEAEADLVNYGHTKTRTLEDEFAEMEKDEVIEAELAALKKSRKPEEASTTA